MPNVKLRSANASTTKDFEIEAVASVDERKNQTIMNYTFPGLDENSTVLNSLFGQEKSIAMAFILLDRSDDYSDGTHGAASSGGTAAQQKDYLFEHIFSNNIDATHYIIDEFGTSHAGRFTDFEIRRTGDDPVKFDVVCQMKIGGNPIATG